MSAPAQIQAAPKQPSRMKLAGVIKGRLSQPIKAVVYGVEGIGKTTFAAGAPRPIFLGAENGSAQLDVERFPTPETWEDVLEAINELATQPHEYKTLAVDSLDWVEPLIWASLCRRHDANSIEDVGGGYGKGYTAAVDEWRRFLSAIERLSNAKGMHILLLAHSAIKPFANPEGPNFDRYELKLHTKSAGLIKEFCDAVLFANHETFAVEDKRTKKHKGVSSNARVIHTERRAAFDAKSRYSLPESLPLSWPDFEAAVAAGAAASPENLRAEILRKAATLGEEFVAKVAATVEKAGNNAQSLALINNRVNAKLSEQDQTTNNEGVKQ